MKRTVVAFLGSSLVLLTACGPLGYGGPFSRPPEAHINLSDTTLNGFDTQARVILMRYFAGNGRWEVREENGIAYAVRREEVNGQYQTTLNGYYSYVSGSQFRQTRVIVSFEQPYSTRGTDRGQFTRANVGEQDVSVTIEGPFSGKPGYSSGVIIEGEGLFLEVYEQSPSIERQFTQQAFEEVSDELSDVLAHLSEIEATGLLPIGSRYPEKPPAAAYLNVIDGIQPGIYLLEAAVNPSSPGMLFAKVYNVKTGQQLSVEYITRRSTRIAAWSTDGATVFPYNAEITVYEGDWDQEYEARFELWHRDRAGHETKMIETTRIINGWER